jgi:hypothetical protein
MGAMTWDSEHSRPVSNPGQTMWEYVDKMALGYVNLLVLRCYPVSVILSVLHTHLFSCHRCYLISSSGSL